MQRLCDIHEEDIAEFFDGKRIKASGALWYAKSDVDAERYRIECKCTEADCYRITENVLDKIYLESLNVGKTPLLCIRFYHSRRDYSDYVCSVATGGLTDDVVVPRGKSYLFHDGGNKILFTFNGYMVYKIEEMGVFSEGK